MTAIAPHLTASSAATASRGARRACLPVLPPRMPSSGCSTSPVSSAASHRLPCNLNTLTPPGCLSSWSPCNGCEAMHRGQRARLTAIKSFSMLLHSESPAHLRRATVYSRFPNTRLTCGWLTPDCRAVPGHPRHPTPNTRLAIRDRAMLQVRVTAGLRVSELVGWRLELRSRSRHHTCISMGVAGRKHRRLHSGDRSRHRCVPGAPFAALGGLSAFCMHAARR